MNHKKVKFNINKYIPRLRSLMNRFKYSIWLFPIILAILLLALTTLKISGSSMGMCYNIINSGKPDPALLFGRAQSIRSDEWTVNTQKIIAQSNNGYKTVNNNIGNGENETLINDVPTRDWSVLFKPHNLAFFILPFDNAFSFRWWAMAYLLITSCYFFILILMPRKRLLASLLSLAMLFSPFFQWWYAYGTLGSVYYCLFGAVIFSKLLNCKRRLYAGLWAALLSYLAVCFALILYPPFQIPCVLILIAYAVGQFLDQRKIVDKKLLKRNLSYFAVSMLTSISIIGIFIYQKLSIINIISSSAYPGQRILDSGGYNPIHLLASNLSPIFQSVTKANAYFFPGIGSTNQSEASNFILILPFLIIPMLFILYKKYKKDKIINYMFSLLFILLAIMLAWMFIPGLDLLGKITLLNKVSISRILIGIGLLNFILTAGFIKLYSQSANRFSVTSSIIYSLCIVILYLLLDFYILLICPLFMGFTVAVILALPIAIIIYCFMRKHFKSAALGLLIFAILSTFYVNPIYRGTDILTRSLLSQTIKEVGKSGNKKWASDDLLTENFPAMNGQGSLSGVYTYPQLDLWKDFTKPGQKKIYNRYAHVYFSFDRNKDTTVRPILLQPGNDQFQVSIEPCDKFLQKNNVGFIITRQKFNEGEAPCATLKKSVVYPSFTFYIYSLTF